jgi:UDP-N-acetylglucosamine transferase subunit ALG13
MTLALGGDNMEENILASIKQMIGSEPDYRHFDKEIIMAINSAFAILFQLGVGPQDKPYMIMDGSETWDEFMDDGQLELVKSYVALKVQTLFDPPTSSFLLSNVNEQIKEFEWRLNVQNETP